MPLYDYCCRLGHTTEDRQGIEVTSIPCPLCGEVAHRQACYPEQYTITETGGVKGPRDRSFRNARGEKLNQLRQSQVEVQRDTGDKYGPFDIRDYDLRKRKRSKERG